MLLGFVSENNLQEKARGFQRGELLLSKIMSVYLVSLNIRIFISK
jgi:hypothetical protein